MKKITKILVDILMYADFIFLMNHGVFRDLTLHGVLGISLFVLFILHHILNLWFYKIAFKGKWNSNRIILNVTDWLLFLLMILMAVSSVGMSGLVFDWSPVQSTQGWRTAHLMSTSWGFIIMNIHLGLHTEKGLKKLEKSLKDKQKLFYNFALILLAAAGIFCFIKTQLYVFMFNTGGWKIPAPNVAAGIFEHLGITAGICALIKLRTIFLPKQ